MNDTIATIIRSVLKVGGGILVTKGLTDSSTVETVVAAIITIVGFVWGIINAKKTQAAK